MNGWMLGAFWGTLLAIPALIVLLYFLKLKRQPVEIPSTYLWLKTIEDLHVNSIWQRLRRSLLLFLQLMFALLLILALLPWSSIFQALGIQWRVNDALDERIVILVDASASMSATDLGKTRLAVAKQRAEELIDRMSNDNVAMIISFSNEARIEQGFTSDRALLKQKLNRIEPTQRNSKIEEALRAAAGLANPGRTSEAGNVLDVQVAEALPATMYLFSDGGVASVPTFNLGNLEPVYVPVGDPVMPSNVAIVTFNAGENSEQPGEYQAFARLTNSSTEDANVELVLYVNGREWDRARVTVPADKDFSFKFDLINLFAGTQEPATIRLEANYDDDLQLDNTAYAVLNPPRLGRVLVVTPGNRPLTTAMQTDMLRRMFLVDVRTPDYLSDETYLRDARTGYYDLIVYDRCSPDEWPMANTVFFGSQPPDDDWSLGEPLFPIVLIDSNQAHPLTQLVDMRPVLVVESRVVTGPPGTATLIEANVGPVASIGPRAGYEDVVFGFALYSQNETGESNANTDWQRNLSFPIFVQNMLEYLSGVASFIESTSVPPGTQVPLLPKYPVETVEVIDPSGEVRRINRDSRNAFIYHDTNQVGIYTVREGDQRELTQRFAVNLFDPRESDLRVRDEMDIGYDEIKAVSSWQSAFPKLWKWILGLGLVILMVEWYIYNKRVYL